jgi:flagellar biosynthesis/type III secretory pathway M-ring protein FliF/YscJ
MTIVEQNGLLTLASLLVLLGGVLPLLRRFTNRAAVARQTAPFSSALSPTARGDGLQRGLEPRTNSLSGQANELVIEAETVRALVSNDPVRTAQVLKEWLSHERSLIRPAI